MRFLADENISRVVTERLRADGIDITSVGQTMAGASDDEVISVARREDRILITEDRDFGEMVIRRRIGVSGVMLLELDRLSNRAEAEGSRTSFRLIRTSSWAVFSWSNPDVFEFVRCCPQNDRANDSGSRRSSSSA